MRIAPNASDGTPDLSDPSKVVTLGNPATIATSRAVNVFTAPPGTTLEASTTYHLVASDSTGTAGAGEVSRTTLNDEDSGGADGWTIGDEHYRRLTNPVEWTSRSFWKVRIGINGYTNPATTDTTPPTVSGATLDSTSLVITFDETLATAANLDNSAFTVTKTPSGGTAETVPLAASPSISGATVTLTLVAGALSTDTVTVAYTKPTSGTGNKLADGAGNEVASFTGQAVTNNSTASVCREGDLQLIGGDNDREGSVQICHDDEWGHVCDDQWRRWTPTSPAASSATRRRARRRSSRSSCS